MLLFISIYAFLKVFSNKIITVNMHFVVISCSLFSLYFLITILSLTFLTSDVSGGYFNVISNDSLRYVYEIGLFSQSPWLVDELNGTFLGYVATPKFGLSSLLAWIFVFNPTDWVYYYIVNNFVVFLFLFFSLKIMLRLFEFYAIGYKGQYFLCFVVLFFPLDLYWSTRFLRESGANSIFMAHILITMLILINSKSRDLLVYVCLSFLLVIYRPQLLVASSFFLLCLSIVSIKPRLLLIACILLCLSLVQSLKAMGAESLSNFLFIGSDLILELLKGFGTQFLIVLSFLVVLFNSLFKENSQSKKININLIILISIFFSSVTVFLWFYIENMQIRFIYPFICFFKIALFMIVIRYHQVKCKTMRVIRSDC